MERFIKELFVFVYPDVFRQQRRRAEPALVTSRKISGGTRSGQGTDSKMTLASLFGTTTLNSFPPLRSARNDNLLHAKLCREATIFMLIPSSAQEDHGLNPAQAADSYP